MCALEKKKNEQESNDNNNGNNGDGSNDNDNDKLSVRLYNFTSITPPPLSLSSTSSYYSHRHGSSNSSSHYSHHHHQEEGDGGGFDVTEECVPLFGCDDPSFFSESDLGTFGTVDEENRAKVRQKNEVAIASHAVPHIFRNLQCFEYLKVKTIFALN